MNTYYTITEVTDFGPHITKVILDYGHSLEGGRFHKEQFHVHVKRSKAKGDCLPLPQIRNITASALEGDRYIRNLYISDSLGFPTPKGHYVSLALHCDPRQTIGSIVQFNGHFNEFVKVQYTISQLTDIVLPQHILPATTFRKNGGNRIVLGDKLKVDHYQHPQYPLSYVYYAPTQVLRPGSRFPLIIWLHGAGSGGTTPLMAAVGNKVVNFISDYAKNIFGPVYLLVPQCPTVWMDDGRGHFTVNGTSCYTQVLDSLIENFIRKHPSIDSNRIYLGGCSNGGFMTMKLLQYNETRYAAAFPVCEALIDSALSDNDIARLSTIPIWFTHAKGDPLVDPEHTVLPTYHRLITAGASNVHFTFLDHVEDPSGLYYKEDGSPYEYDRHWSWIYTLNDKCYTDFDGRPVIYDGQEVSIFEWLAMQKK